LTAGVPPAPSWTPFQVFVEAGNEAETIVELERVAEALLWIADLRVIVVLVLDRWRLPLAV
jgi:hypothetical protein